MNEHPINTDELQELLGKLIENDLSMGERKQLESALLGSAEYRRLHREILHVHASLTWSRRWQPENVSTIGIGETAETTAAVSPSSPTIGIPTSWGVVLGGVVTALAAMLLLMLSQMPEQDTSEDPINQMAVVDSADLNDKRLDSIVRVNDVSARSVRLDSSPAAFISETAGVRWSDGIQHRSGDSLMAGPLRFDAGMVQLDFSAGARLVIRGPADLELISSKSVRIRSGEATCYVGELGKGFQILTGESEVIDLGTSFGIRVEPTGESEVHVFEGAVSIRQQPGSPAVEFAENKAVRISKEALIETDYSAIGFPKYEEIQSKHRRQKMAQYETWKKNADLISNDPSVLVHYTFEDIKASDIDVVNHSKHDNRGSNGAILNAKLTNGRWPGKKALRFQKEHDRILMAVPGEHSQLTFMVWARVDAFLQHNTALMLTEHPRRWKIHGVLTNQEVEDAISRRNVAVVDTTRWMLTDQGEARLNLSYMAADRQSFDYKLFKSGHFPASDQTFEKWICYAVTYDSLAERVIHYCDGEQVSVASMPRPAPLLLDYMEIGNLTTSPEEREQGVSYRFFGSMDEIVIANRIFAAEEIREIYQVGCPDLAESLTSASK